MFSKKKESNRAQASIMSAFALVMMLSPFTTIKAGELPDNDANINAICTCTESDQMAKTANCQRLFADMFPEQQPQHARAPASAGHMVAPPIQQPIQQPMQQSAGGR